ncbi:hypothetical protein [Roseiarcus fermentans]|nr:hypothetical protein [Roseiarcus fermentans]
MAIQSRWAKSQPPTNAAPEADGPWIAASPCGLLARTGVVIASREAPSSS